MVQILWKSVQEILRYFGSKQIVRYDTKSVAMVTSLKESEKLGWIEKIHANTFHLVKKSFYLSRSWDSFAYSKNKKKLEMRGKA